MAHEMERRNFPIEVRATEKTEGGKNTLRGYAAVFNKDSEEMYGFRERIAPGAFKKTIQEGDIRAFWNHDTSRIIGRTKNNTLRLSEDKVGLAVEIDPPDTQDARDYVTLVEEGYVDQMSFGFQVVKDSWEYDKKGDIVMRTLHEVKLFEVSPVSIPAYPDTSISARALDKAREIRESVTETEPPPVEHSETKADITSDDAAQAAQREAEALAAAEAEALLLEVQIAQSTI